MKNKRVVVLLMAALLTTSSWLDRGVVYAAEVNQYQLMESETTQEENVTDTDTVEEADKKDDIVEEKQNDGIGVYSDEIQTQSYDMIGITVETATDGTITVTSDGVESAMPGLMDASTVVYHDLDGSQEVESRTWDVPINIVMKNCETTTSSGGDDSLGGLEALDVNKGHLTYIFNQPVNITVDGGSASAMSLIRSNMVSNYSKWIFNAPVTFTVKNGEFPYINGMQVLNGYNYYTEKGKNWGVEMNDTYTMTVENCTDVTAINGAGKKNRTRTWSSQNGRVDDFSCGFKKGLTLNVKDTDVSDSIIPGHILKQTSKDGGPDEQYQYWAEGDVIVNLDNVHVEDFASSQSSKLMAGKTDLDGNLIVNLTNGSTINTFFGENVPYGKPSVSTLVGNVTGTSRLNMTSGATMEALAGLEELTLAGAIQITSLFTLPDAGMKVYVAKDVKWNNGDILLSYHYLTDPEYVKVDNNLLISNWDDPNLQLQYRDVTADARQEWYLNKDVTVIFDSDGGTDVASQTVRQGATVKEPTEPTKLYSVFEGWYTDNTYTTRWEFTNPVNQDMTLYAKWRAETADVKVSEKDGSKEYGIVTIEKGTPVTTEKLPTVEKAGYTVEKWITSDGREWNIENDSVTADIEIHPVWKLNEPEVNLIADGNVTKIHAGDSVKLIAEAVHEAEENLTYQFKWYKDGKEFKENEMEDVTRVTGDSNPGEIVVSESGTYSVKVIVSDEANRTSEEIESNSIDIEVTAHDFTGDWEKDDESHWHICQIENCNVTSDKATHTYGEWTIEKAATRTEEGVRVRICNVCGFQEKAAIPVISEVDNKDDGKDDAGKNEGKTETTTTIKMEVKSTGKVRTGDVRNLGIWAAILMLSGVATILLAGKKQRR